MHSCIYAGQVSHRRFVPKVHEFRYGLFMMYLDLGELPDLFDRFWLWSARGRALARFRRKDHLGGEKQPLSDAVRQCVQQQCGFRPAGPIRLLTHLAYFGYRFNPVSFYYCFDTKDTQVEAIVAEVNNTPWGEQHCYVLDSRRRKTSNGHLSFQLDKEFHVSPFMPMDLHYDWRFLVPDERLNVHMRSLRDGQCVFDATLRLKRRPLNSMQLARILTVYPLMTVKVIVAVYYQALRLWLKRIPLFTHPDKLGDACSAKKR